MNIQQRTCILSIDVEEDLRSNPPTFRCIEKMEPLLTIMEFFEARVTLFVTGDILKNFSEKIFEWKKRGHEIACHGWKHTPLLDILEKDRRDHLEQFIALYQDFFHTLPKGFRAVQLRIDEMQFRLLKEYGFVYDSSVLSSYIPLRRSKAYQGSAPKSPYHPEKENFLQQSSDNPFWEMPITTTWGGVPLYGTWLRYLGPKILGSFTPRSRYLSFGCHPWDANKYEGLLPYKSGEPFLRELEKFFKILQRRNYQFTSYEQYLLSQ